MEQFVSHARLNCALNSPTIKRVQNEPFIRLYKLYNLNVKTIVQTLNNIFNFLSLF